MEEGYRQLALGERKEIERGLSRTDSFREIARAIGRSPSTVSREVRENRSVRAFKPRKKGAARRPTSHSRKRSHDEFEKLPGELRAARTELDSVIRRSADRKAVLTPCNLPTTSGSACLSPRTTAAA